MPSFVTCTKTASNTASQLAVIASEAILLLLNNFLGLKEVSAAGIEQVVSQKCSVSTNFLARYFLPYLLSLLTKTSHNIRAIVKSLLQLLTKTVYDIRMIVKSQAFLKDFDFIFVQTLRTTRCQQTSSLGISFLICFQYKQNLVITLKQCKNHRHF